MVAAASEKQRDGRCADDDDTNNNDDNDDGTEQQAAGSEASSASDLDNDDRHSEEEPEEEENEDEDEEEYGEEDDDYSDSVDDGDSDSHHDSDHDYYLNRGYEEDYPAVQMLAYLQRRDCPPSDSHSDSIVSESAETRLGRVRHAECIPQHEFAIDSGGLVAIFARAEIPIRPTRSSVGRESKDPSQYNATLPGFISV